MGRRKHRKLSKREPKIDEGECADGWHLQYESDPEERQFRDVFADSILSPMHGFEFFGRDEAIDIGQALIDRRVGVQQSNEEGMKFSSDRFYQLVEDDENKPLNYTYSSDIPLKKKLVTVAEFNSWLIPILEDIYEDIVVEKGQTILYDDLGSHVRFSELFALIKRLQEVDVGSSSNNERLAFFLNVYNLMVIHFNMVNGPPQSIWQRRKLFNSTYYQIGEHKYALHSILNGILRGNKKGPDMLWKALGKQDHRRPYVIRDCECLIHFAVITGVRTTPPLRLYTCENVLDEIRQNMEATLQQNNYLRIDMKKSVIYVAKTFKWFSADFAEHKKDVAHFILEALTFVNCEKKTNLEKLVGTDEFTVDYLTFDWNSNGNHKTQRDQMADFSRRVSAKSTCSLTAQSELRQRFKTSKESIMQHNNNVIEEELDKNL